MIQNRIVVSLKTTIIERALYVRCEGFSEMHALDGSFCTTKIRIYLNMVLFNIIWSVGPPSEKPRKSRVLTFQSRLEKVLC